MIELLTPPTDTMRPRSERTLACDSCVFWVIGIGCSRSQSMNFRSKQPVSECVHQRDFPGARATPRLKVA